MSLFDAIMKLKDTIVSGGDARDIWADFKNLVDMVIGAGGGFASPDTGGDVKSACAQLKSACETRATEVAAGDGVKKIGDGTILKLVMEFLPLILALLG